MPAVTRISHWVVVNGAGRESTAASMFFEIDLDQSAVLASARNAVGLRD
jgi:hypothetical protein